MQKVGWILVFRLILPHKQLGIPSYLVKRPPRAFHPYSPSSHQSAFHKVQFNLRHENMELEEKPSCLFNHRKSQDFPSPLALTLKSCNIADSSLSRRLRNQCNKSQSRRRKACRHCVINKTRCSLKRPACSRYHVRNTPCQYTISEEPSTPTIGRHDLSESERIAIDSASPNISPLFRPQLLQSTFDPSLFDTLFTDVGT